MLPRNVSNFFMLGNIPKGQQVDKLSALKYSKQFPDMTYIPQCLIPITLSLNFSPRGESSLWQKVRWVCIENVNSGKNVWQYSPYYNL